MKQIVLCIAFLVMLGVASGWVAEASYFDARTGHRYIRYGSDTYAEFSRKGRFLKLVPADLPLLVHGSSIHPITDECYVVYERCLEGKMVYQPIPATDPHPEGWKAQKLLRLLK